MTAVEWLEKEMNASDWWYLSQSMKQDIIKQAKAMEKEQIMESYMKAKLEHIDTLGLNAVKNKIINDTEQYYTENFKSE